MLLDYLAGNHDAAVEVDSTTLEMSLMSGKVMFRGPGRMDELERRGLACCTGNVLDVGGGSGCHSLWLQQQGLQVDTLDISPGCIEVMRRRGVAHPFHRNFFSHQGRKYDTILMLMNGLGICGTMTGLQVLLQHAGELLASGGSVIADSTDLTPLYRRARRRRRSKAYGGETVFVMKYGEIISDPFPWLYIDFTTMRNVAGSYGLCCEKLADLSEGRYLVRLW